MSARIAEVASCPGPSDHQKTGRGTTFSERTRRAQRSNTGRSISRLMGYSRPPSERSHL